MNIGMIRQTVHKLLLLSSVFAIMIFALPKPAASAAATDGNIATIYTQNGLAPVIRILSSDGSSVVRDLPVAQVNDTISAIAWSPLGDKLAYMIQEQGLNTSVWTINVDGTEDTLLVDLSNQYGLAAQDSVSWAPYGYQIAFTHNGSLYVVNDDGSKLFGTVHDSNVNRVRWVMNDRLGIQTSESFGMVSLYGYESGGNTRQYYPWYDSPHSFSPAPDSKVYAYNGNSLGDKIFIRNSSNDLIDTIDCSSEQCGSPSWSVGSDKLLYTTMTGMYPFTSKLVTHDVDSKATTTLTTVPSGGSYQQPQWQPVGQTLTQPNVTTFEYRNVQSGVHTYSHSPNLAVPFFGDYSTLSKEGEFVNGAMPWDSDSVPVYRLIDDEAGTELLTIDDDEALTAINDYGWRLEETPLFAFTAPGSNRMPVFRFNDPATQSRIYSADMNSVATQQYTYNKNLDYEGIAFYVPLDSAKYDSQSVYRMTNYITGERIFTQNPEEVLYAQDLYPGWKYEGVAFKSAPEADATSSPIYRLTNYYKKERVFTPSKYEADYAVSHYPGWVYEGEVFRSYNTQESGTVPVYRLVNWAYGGRLFTANKAEVDYAIAHYPGWVSEGIAFYTKP